MLKVFGDYIEQDSRWPKMRQADVDFGDAVRAAGGGVDVVNLPDAGIKGSSHLLMMDKNNAEVAELIQKWLAGKGRWNLETAGSQHAVCPLGNLDPKKIAEEPGAALTASLTVLVQHTFTLGV